MNGCVGMMFCWPPGFLREADCHHLCLTKNATTRVSSLVPVKIIAYEIADISD